MNPDRYSANQLLEFAGGDNEFVCGLLEMFLVQAQKDIENMRSLTEAKNWDEMKFVAHRLRSSAGSVGANGIAVTCSELETYLKSSGGVKKDVSLYVDNFLTTTVSELTEIEQELKKLTDGGI